MNDDWIWLGTFGNIWELLACACLLRHGWVVLPRTCAWMMLSGDVFLQSGWDIFLLKAPQWVKHAAGNGFMGAGDWDMETLLMTAWLQADWGWFAQFWSDMFEWNHANWWEILEMWMWSNKQTRDMRISIKKGYMNHETRGNPKHDSQTWSWQFGENVKGWRQWCPIVEVKRDARWCQLLVDTRGDWDTGPNSKLEFVAVNL